MLNLLKDAKQTALETGEKAIRLFFEIVAVASERIHSKPGERPEFHDPYSPRVEPVPPPVTPAPPAAAARPTPAVAAKPKAAKPRRAAPKRGGKKRPDQLLRVLGLLQDSSGTWLSAKEISDAGGTSGTPILPGNVRKVIRARGNEVIETRPREGSRRGALEYRITDAGKQRLDR